MKAKKLKATSNCMTPSTDLVLCKHVTYVFSASHTLYQSKMASVTVRYRKKNTKNIRRCKLERKTERNCEKTILSGFAGSLSFFVPLPSRAISHARGHLRVSRFARQTTEKRETARSLDMFGSPNQT